MLLDGTDANSIDENNNIIEPDGSTKVILEAQRETRLIDSEKNIAVFRLPRRPVKTLLTDYQ